MNTDAFLSPFQWLLRCLSHRVRIRTSYLGWKCGRDACILLAECLVSSFSILGDAVSNNSRLSSGEGEFDGKRTFSFVLLI